MPSRRTNPPWLALCCYTGLLAASTALQAQDTTPPELFLIGSDPVDVPFHGSYQDAGASASDDNDGDITESVVVGGDTIDTSKPGYYLVTYDVQDAAGNSATQISRTVSVGENLFGCLPVTVGLFIENDTDSNGINSVVNGNKVRVGWEVLDDPDKRLNKKDKLELRRVHDNKLLASAERGKGSTGTVSLKAKNSQEDELYVRYRAKKDGSYPCAIPNLLDPSYVPLMSIPGADLASMALRLNAAESPPRKRYRIGDPGPAGGIVFDVSADGYHGIEAAPAGSLDTSQVPWGCRGEDIDGADGDSGGQNTGDILSGCLDAGIAARLAANYWHNGFGDWYLPTRDEMETLYLNIGSATNNTGAFESAFYWTSNESETNGGDNDKTVAALVLKLNDSNSDFIAAFKDDLHRVRPVRRF